METSAVQSIKLVIVELTGLSKDALHVYVGLGIFLAAAAVSRRGLRSILPLLTVLAVAIAGELVDMREDLSRHGYFHWEGSLLDLLNTLFWPAAIWFLARAGILFAENKKRE